MARDPDLPAHDDDPTAEVDGVRNLTPAEYTATYAEGDPHPVAPPEVLAALGIDTGEED